MATKVYWATFVPPDKLDVVLVNGDDAFPDQPKHDIMLKLGFGMTFNDIYYDDVKICSAAELEKYLSSKLKPKHNDGFGIK